MIMRHRRTCSRRGFALVAVMWVVLMAGLILLGVQTAARTNLAMSHNELELVRAHWLARAGIEQALAVLEDDDKAADGMLDDWYRDEESFRQVELAGGVFNVTASPGTGDDPLEPRYGLGDCCGRLNLNTADGEALKALDLLDGWQIESLLDWVDADNNARANGAEDAFYAQLAYPYEIRNGPLATLGELLLVQGFDRPALLGEDANLNGLLDVNEDDADASQPDDDANGELKSGLAALAAVHSYELNRDGSGGERVNINKADKQTLMSRLGLSDALAEAVVNARGGGQQQGGNAGGGNGGSPGQNGQGGANSGANNSGSGQGGEQKDNANAGQSGQQASGFKSLMDLLNVKPQQQNNNGQAGQQASGGSDSANSGDSGSSGGGSVTEFTLKWIADRFDDLTLSDEQRLAGRINVNTAPRQVLLTLPQMTISTADAIVRRQAGGKGPFRGVGELLSDAVLSDEQFKAMAERLCVRSAVMEIRSEGVTRFGARGVITAVVDRGSGEQTILYWSQSQ